jgi:hypothetical protein
MGADHVRDAMDKLANKVVDDFYEEIVARHNLSAVEQHQAAQYLSQQILKWEAFHERRGA